MSRVKTRVLEYIKKLSKINVGASAFIHYGANKCVCFSVITGLDIGFYFKQRVRNAALFDITEFTLFISTKPERLISKRTYECIRSYQQFALTYSE